MGGFCRQAGLSKQSVGAAGQAGGAEFSSGQEQELLLHFSRS